MSTVPVTSWGLLAVAVVTICVTILTAFGVGARSRVLGLQVPLVRKNSQTWIAGHRASLKIILPVSSIAAIIALLAVGQPNEGLIPLGWVICLLSGGAVATSAARRIRDK